ncbi:transposase [Clostridium estertheticum]|nr:Tn3 family transposase [Clostridium estertheticum]MBU3187602.1 transposase [Clostridium estertheticum]
MGRITPSTILHKIGSYSRKNKLYQAFSELRKALRTGFHLKYILDIDSRRIIQETSNKNKSFNGFTKWINFGNDGVITSNNREDQRKRIKYNHLVTNTITFYNIFHMPEILHGLSSEGYDINKDVVSSLAPYMTSHINRFGKYSIDKNIKIPELKFDINVI